MQRLKLLSIMSSLCIGTALAGTSVAQDIDTDTALHARLIGTWDVSYDIYDKDGIVRHNLGQVICSWALTTKEAGARRDSSSSRRMRKRGSRRTFFLWDPWKAGDSCRKHRRQMRFNML